MNILAWIRAAFLRAAPDDTDASAFASAVKPISDPKFGDYQANGCMAVGKKRGTNPREVAAEVVRKVDLSPWANEPEIAGPGFINIRLRDDRLAEYLGELSTDERLGIEPAERPKTVVIDYSSPNVAKPMHVGHVRSTVIGECLARTYETLGHRVIRDNHLGDWGAQFGMILWGWKNERDDRAFEADPVRELARLYKLAQARIKPGETLSDRYKKVFEFEKEGKFAEAEALFAKLATDSKATRDEVDRVLAESRAIAEACRAETAKLHAGDPENRALWERFMPYCLGALQTIYDRLGVRFDVQLGESFYDSMLAETVEKLEKDGIARESEGAKVVFTRENGAPMIIQKSDGAFTYATTDLATLRYRYETWRPDLILYVVDHRQSDHFKQLFAVAAAAGFGETDPRHVAFGTILGADKKPYKTRDGDVVGLESLLDEAVARARAVVDRNSPELSEEERGKVAEVVGLGAIKYADLSQNRLSDYVFDWDKMLAMNGNTGAYLQYAYARIQSIFRKGEIDVESLRRRVPAVALGSASERALAVAIVRLPETLELAANDLKPNVLTDYLFDLANRFSTFYDDCPVLKAEPEKRDSRLALCDLTARILKLGLRVLGIETRDRM